MIEKKLIYVFFFFVKNYLFYIFLLTLPPIFNRLES